MSKLTAICCSVLLHIMFVVGFAAVGTAATVIAADRAAHVALLV